MDFTFGIITAGKADGPIQSIVDSIRAQQIPNYEILIVGVCDLVGPDLRVIPFDETVRPGWISRKKNIIIEEAKYEFLCIVHDYVALEPGWYDGFKGLQETWQFGASKIKNTDGSRYRDYVFFRWGADLFPKGTWIPYDCELETHQQKLLYVSGAYFVVRTSVARAHPLNEKLGHGQGEDVEYSLRLSRHDIPIQFNPTSTVRFLRHRGRVEFDYELTSNELERLRAIPLEEYEEAHNRQWRYLQCWLASTFGIGL